MGLLESFLESFGGRVHFMVLVGTEPALEIKLRDKDIVVEVKNPLLAVEFGLQELAKGGKIDSRIFREIKKLGYRIKIKYGILELDL